VTADDPIFEPQDFIRYFRSTHPWSASEIRLPPRVVFVFGTWFFRVCSKALRAQTVRWNPSVSLGHAGRHPVAVVRTSIGAPAAAIDLEESIALGARMFVVFGACGSLQNDLSIGGTVLPTAALSDEGTSKHYEGSRSAHPDDRLVRRLRAACRRRSLRVREGVVWTTDGVYRESRSRIRSLARRGVLGVEMEASALFTVARYRHVPLAGLLVVSDEVGGDVWKPGFQEPPFRHGVQHTLEAVVDVVSGALP